MYRGLGRELLSIISWILGGAGRRRISTFTVKAWQLTITQQLNLPNPKIAQIGIAVVVGLVALIVIHLITARISRRNSGQQRRRD